MKRVLTITGFLLLATMSAAAQSASAAEKPGQSLSPELEMAVIRQLNLEDRIATRQAVLPKRSEGQDGGANVSGEWVCFTTMFLNGPTGRGIMYLNMKQDGDVISGGGRAAEAPLRSTLDHQNLSRKERRGAILQASGIKGSKNSHDGAGASASNQDLGDFYGSDCR